MDHLNDILKELQGIYDIIGLAFREKDLDGIARYVAEDWHGTAKCESVTREQLLENVHGQFERFNDINWDRRIESSHNAGDEVTVRASGIYRAMEADSEKPVKMNLVNDDTWVRGPSGWQTIRSVAVEHGSLN